MANFPVQGQKPWGAALRTYIEALPSDAGPFKTALNAVIASAITSKADTSTVSSLIASGISGKANTVHTHTSTDVTDFIEAVQDAVAAMLTSGANVTLAYNDAGNTLQVTASGTDAEVVRDTIGAALVGINGLGVAVNDAADTITLSVSGLTVAQTTGLQAALDSKQALQQVATTVTADGVAVVNKHNPVDATAAARTITLPTGQAEGTQISVEKVDASTNAVSISGNIRATAGTTIALTYQSESLMLRASSTGSWWPIAGHRTKVSLDAAYVKPTNARPVVRLGVFTEAANPNSETEFVTVAGEPVTVEMVAYNFITQPNVSTLTALNARGVTPMVTWMPNGATEGPTNPSYRLSTILSGTFDAYMTTFLNTIKGLGFPVMLKWGPEMNGDWTAWSEGQNGNTTGQFAQAWRYIHDLAVSLGVTNVIWCWSPTTKYTSSIPLAGLYPGDAYVDMVAVHGYNYGTAGPSGLRTPSAVYDPTFDEIAGIVRGKPLWLGECGTVDTSGEKAGWFTQFFDWMIARGLAGFVYFNSNSVAEGYDWRVNSTPAASTAFAAGMAKLRKVAQATGKAVAQADGRNNWTGTQDFRGAQLLGLTTPAHAASHATGASDPITPDSISAAPATLTNNFFTADTTLALWNAGRRMLFDTTTAVTATIPTNATVAFPIGTEITLAQMGTGQLTIAPAAGVTLHSRGDIFRTAGRYAFAGLIKTDVNVWMAYGDLVA